MSFSYSSGAEKTVRDTDELFKILKRPGSMTNALKALEGNIATQGFKECLAALMLERGLNAGQLSEAALLSRSFTYQLCNGDRSPSRDIVLRLALVLELTLEQAQSLLRAAQRGALYPRVMRDAIIIYALQNHLSIQATDEQLSSRGLAGIL